MQRQCVRVLFLSLAVSVLYLAASAWQEPRPQVIVGIDGAAHAPAASLGAAGGLDPAALLMLLGVTRGMSG